MKKVAVITGASQGIGKAVALSWAEDYHVILLARSEKKLQELKQQIEKRGQTADVYVLDVTDSAKVYATVDDIIHRFNRIDFLFNGAGIFSFGTSDMPITEIETMLKTNLFGTIYVSNAVAAHMKKQKNGYIFTMSSIAGKRGMPRSGIYCASKFGVSGYSEALFKELLAYDVKVTALCPSTVATDMTKGFPLDQKLMIPAEDIVKTVNYLLSLNDNTAIAEIIIQCSAFVVQESQAVTEKLFKSAKD